MSDDKVYEAIVSAYYARAIGAADRARLRAQSASVTTGAAAAALLGLGVLANISKYDEPIRWIGSAGVTAWIVAALLYSMAISFPPKLPSIGTSERDRIAFMKTVLESSRAEAEGVDQRRKIASAVSLIALALTLIATGSAVLAGPSDSRSVPVGVVLSDLGRRALEATCGRMMTEISGDIKPSSLSLTTMRVDLPAGACGTSPASLQLFKEEIWTVEYKG